MNPPESNIDSSYISHQTPKSSPRVTSYVSRVANAASHLFTANGKPIARRTIMDDQFSDSYFDERSR
jgi:hypothetical protein